MSDTGIHMIGQAHIDPVWLWRWPEGYAEIRATFRSALDRMKEDPDFVFVSACASYYRWIERNQRDMFEEIRARVREGRWVLAGGWWVQPDCNAPSGESFARHSLYGQRYFLSVFGKMAEVGYNVDSFGHNGMIPQILQKSGMGGYVFMRPGPHENAEIPASLFVWEGVDGTRVPAFRIHESYNASGDPQLPDRVAAVRGIAERENAPMMCFYGVGNHGGGPTRQSLEQIRAMGRERPYPVKYSSPTAYFEEIVPLIDGLPVYKGDLQFHAKGCYSTASELKAANRRAENALISAEKLGVLARSLTGREAENGEMQRAWERVLNNQFHDVMGGCSVKSALDDAIRFYGEACSIADEQITSAAHRVSWAVDTSAHAPTVRDKSVSSRSWEYEDNGAPVVVFNPLGWPVSRQVAINYPAASVTDENGNPVPFQRVKAPYMTNPKGTYQTLITAELPSMGYRTYWAYVKKEYPRAAPGELSATGNALENALIRVEIDEQTGGIGVLTDKASGFAAVKNSRAIVIDMGESDTWAHRAVAFRDEVGAFGGAELRLLESGPLRAALRSTARFGESELVQDYVLTPDSGYIEVRARLTCRMVRKMVKLAFPTPLQDTAIAYEIAYGSIVRATDGAEHHGQQFADIHGLAGGRPYGVALVNDGRYSYDALAGEMRLTVANTSYYGDHVGYGVPLDDCNQPMDNGVLEFTYRLMPHAGGWDDPAVRAAVTKLGHELNTPEVLVHETFHDGPLPMRYEGLRLSGGRVLATAFKLAEDGGGYVLRLVECGGMKTETAVELPVLSRSLTVSLMPMEIKSLYLPLDAKQPVRECDLLEMIRN